jgi:aspartate/methionine/tyrosine aminotransferase
LLTIVLVISINPFTFAAKYQGYESCRHLSETLIGSEIVKLGGEIREKMRQGEKIYNFTVGDFDPSIFPIPKELEDEIVTAYRNHFTNYPAAEGNLDLREAIASFMKEWEKLDYSLGEILVSSGGVRLSMLPIVLFVIKVIK